MKIIQFKPWRALLALSQSVGHLSGSSYFSFRLRVTRGNRKTGGGGATLGIIVRFPLSYVIPDLGYATGHVLNDITRSSGI